MGNVATRMTEENRIRDCSRSNQMPETGQTTEIATYLFLSCHLIYHDKDIDYRTKLEYPNSYPPCWLVLIDRLNPDGEAMSIQRIDR